MRQMRLNIREFNDIYPRLSREVDANPTDKLPEWRRVIRNADQAIEELAILMEKYQIKTGIIKTEEEKMDADKEE